MKVKTSRSDRVFDWVLNLLMLIVLLVVAYPLYFVLIASVSNPDLTYAGKVVWFPNGVTMAGYDAILNDGRVWSRYFNTILYTTVGTLVNLVLTLPAAYALSRKRFWARRYINLFIIFTMFFSGGLIPTYLLVQDLHLLDSMWALVLVSGVSAWNLIIARTFFASNIPDELEESALLDGCSQIRFFLSVVMPLSKVIIVVLALFYGISHWNGYFNALIYLNTPEKFPLQLFLRDILIQNENMSMDPTVAMETRYTANLLKYSMIVVSIVPVLVIYPFLQKFFVKGVLIGSVKG